MSEKVIDVYRRKILEGKNANANSAPPKNEHAIPKKIGPVAWYDPTNGCYWMQNGRGEWQKTNETHLKRFLSERTYRAVSQGEGKRSMIENHLIELQLNHDVAYAGPLAGWRTGMHDICGNRVLVTREGRPIKPTSGKWDALREFLETLLPDGQSIHLLAWIKASCQSMRSGAPYRPGQALAIAGPAGCGKSLLQNLITEIFGGRSCKPYKFIQGRTDFNAEHLGCEHLMIEDEQASTQIGMRRDMGAAIKAMIVNETQVCYRKNKEPVMLMPFWRMSISLNDEAENLMVLPPLDDSLRDKIIMLKASKAKIPYDADDMAGRRKWRQTLSNELPGMLAYLAQWRLPSAKQDARYGCSAWQHPELLEALDDLSPEMRLLSLIDALRPWPYGNQPWIGTANDLEEKLLEKDKLGRVAKLLGFNTACGVYLSRLAKCRKERVEIMDRKSGKAIWKISMPSEEPLPQ